MKKNNQKIVMYGTLFIFGLVTAAGSTIMMHFVESMSECIGVAIACYSLFKINKECKPHDDVKSFENGHNK